jgi:RNA-directed DNA polymerase
LHKKDFQKVFQSYFHNKYSFDTFLHTKLIESYNFKSNNFQTHLVMSYIKKNKSTKQLVPISQELRDYHTFLNNILFNYMNVSNCVYSYQQNKSVFNTVSLHKDSKSYFKTDIKSFFKSINRELVLKCLINNISRYPVDENIKNYLEKIVDLVVYDNHLPVGFVTSPGISNAILYDFDNVLEEYCQLHHIIYTRYSDDLIFSSNNHTVLENLQQVIIQSLSSLYGDCFILNQEKTSFLDKTDRVLLLGLVITPDGHITVNRHLKEDIKQLLYFYMNDKEKFNTFLKLRYGDSIIKAYGSLNYINDVDKNFVLKLRTKYGNYVVDKFLHGNKNI